MPPKTMFDKIWADHLIHEAKDEPSVIYVDLHLVHEVTSAQAFDGLRLAGRKVRRTDLTVATADHNTPTWDLALPVTDEVSKAQLDALDLPAALVGQPTESLVEGQHVQHAVGCDRDGLVQRHLPGAAETMDRPLS